MPAAGHPSYRNTSTSVEHYKHHNSPTATSSSSRNDSASGSSAKERLDAYLHHMGKTSSPIQSHSTNPEDARLVQYLAKQAFHLPGNTWMQDWWQYMWNNHPVFGICYHHPRHPIKACTRFVALIGTVMVGLALTNMFYLFYLWNPQLNQPVFTVVVNDTNQWTLTTGMLLLWTIGGGMHTCFNLVQWHIAACACCRAGGCCERNACCPSLGKRLLRVFVVMIVGLTVLIILMRVAATNAEDDDEDENSLTSSNANTTTTTIDGDTTFNTGGGGIHFFGEDDPFEIEVHSAQEFQFLVGYLVEMVLALFVYFPLAGTILFSGCLVCGKLPVLGGRPYEVRAEEKRQRRRQLRAQRGYSTSDDSNTTKPVHVEHLQEDEHGDDSDDRSDDLEDGLHRYSTSSRQVVPSSHRSSGRGR